LKTGETVLKKACAPKNDGVATATELVGNLKIGWLIFGCQPQDEPTTEDQCLRRGMGPGQGLQAVLSFEIKDNRWRKGVWHDGHPCHKTGAIYQFDVNALFCLDQLQLPSDL
jgi:hypothetical protein